MRTLVSITDLQVELAEWERRLCVAAERWVEARAAGVDTSHLEAEQQRCERNVRRLERRIRRRRR